MIETKVYFRGEGKTTEVIKRMKENKDLYCIIPYSHQIRYYPKDLQDRIFSGNMELYRQLRGRNVKTVILDEGYAYQKDKIAQMYYTLGQMDIDVIAIGTLKN